MQKAENLQISEGETVVNSIGMLVTIISFSMLFATLFLGYFIFRLTSTQWPPMNLDRVRPFYPGLSTLLVISSSWFYEVFKKKINSNGSLAKYNFLSALALGIGFLISQLLFWQDLKAVGIFASSGIYGSLLYTLTWVHSGHMLIAVGMLFFLLPSVLREDFKKRIRIINVGKFWHFLAVVWLIMYLALFVF